MRRLWIEVGFSPETFWQQTERSFVAAVEARAEALKREVEQNKRLAYNTAILSALAMAGKLKPFDECFRGPDESNGATALLGALFKMKRRGVDMTIERVSLH